jgi:hypothetical protein
MDSPASVKEPASSASLCAIWDIYSEREEEKSEAYLVHCTTPPTTHRLQHTWQTDGTLTVGKKEASDQKL